MQHPSKERTLVVIKPDGIQRSLIGEIIKRYERMGLKIIAMKMLLADENFIEKHYTLDPNWKMENGIKTIQSYKDKGLIPPSEDPLEVNANTLRNLKKYITSGPIIAMVWQGLHSVKIARKITGGTEPLTSDVGTIRGDYVLDSYEVSDADSRSIRNLIHASGSVDEAENEIKLWFKEEEIMKYKVVQESILYDSNLVGIMD